MKQNALSGVNRIKAKKGKSWFGTAKERKSTAERFPQLPAQQATPEPCGDESRRSPR
jgi:hypothetical protein